MNQPSPCRREDGERHFVVSEPGSAFGAGPGQKGQRVQNRLDGVVCLELDSLEQGEENASSGLVAPDEILVVSPLLGLSQRLDSLDCPGEFLSGDPPEQGSPGGLEIGKRRVH